jgi:hypothetical protein
MLRRMIKDYFATPKAERGKYKGPPLYYDPDPLEPEEEEETGEHSPPEQYLRTAAELDKMTDEQWQQLVLDFIERPEVLISAPVAVLVLQLRALSSAVVRVCGVGLVMAAPFGPSDDEGYFGDRLE